MNPKPTPKPKPRRHHPNAAPTPPQTPPPAPIEPPPRPSKFSKEQKEGVGRVLDTLTASAIIGLALGATGYQRIEAIHMWLLTALIPSLIFFALTLRKPTS